MSAWGSGSFENDTAMDWAASVDTADDVSGPFLRLKAVADGEPGDQIDPIDADLASELIAAAETVAMMMGRRIPNFPPELEQAVGGAQPVEKLLFHRARNAVLCVLRNSELAELWEEAAEETGENEWTAELSELSRRLDPDIEFTPVPDDYIDGLLELDETLEADPMRCGFCNQPIASEKLFAFRVTDFNDMVNGQQTFWVHLPCLNKRLHHKHALHNMKFDPDDADFDLDQV